MHKLTLTISKIIFPASVHCSQEIVYTARAAHHAMSVSTRVLHRSRYSEANGQVSTQQQ